MTRDDLELLDTESLRALARQRLVGQGRALRSRGALLTALARTLAPDPPLQTVAPTPGGGRRRRPPRKVTGGSVGQSPTFAAAAAPRPPLDTSAPPPGGASPPPSPGPADGLVEEGFFVVRHRERRPSGASRPPALPPQEQTTADAVARTGPRPPLPGDEVPHLLARDPTTAFLFWDFRADLERGAAFGLNEPRVLFHLYDGETRVRTLEVPLGRRSLYLDGLEPGHVYSVEAWFSGSDGHARPTGRRSAPLRLAPAAQSERLEVQMAHVPWEQPLSTWQAAPAPPASPVRVEALDAPARVDLPASLGFRGGPGPAGPGPGGPRSGRS
jgi:hypothetical protein